MCGIFADSEKFYRGNLLPRTPGRGRPLGAGFREDRTRGEKAVHWNGFRGNAPLALCCLAALGALTG